MMRKLFIEMMGNGDDDGEGGDDDGRSERERRRRRRERDEEPGGAARGAVGPGRSSRRRRGVAVPVLREDCVEDCGVFAVVRKAYVVLLDRPFAARSVRVKVRVDDGRRVDTDFPASSVRVNRRRVDADVAHLNYRRRRQLPEGGRRRRGHRVLHVAYHRL